MKRIDPVFREWRDSGLVWLPEHGMGYYPVTEAPYDQAYFDKYTEYRGSDIERALNRVRVSMVERHLHMAAEVLDIGIGDGAFIETRGEPTFGFDINPAGVAWLKERGLYRDPRRPVRAMTFWDVLEHIHDPGPLLRNARVMAFVSLPIFTGPDHVLRSKHFRPAEHCWYWTRDGFIAWMGEHGFNCVEHGTGESLAGREDIESFAFRRVRVATHSAVKGAA